MTVLSKVALIFTALPILAQADCTAILQKRPCERDASCKWARNPTQRCIDKDADPHGGCPGRQQAFCNAPCHWQPGGVGCLDDPMDHPCESRSRNQCNAPCHWATGPSGGCLSDPADNPCKHRSKNQCNAPCHWSPVTSCTDTPSGPGPCAGRRKNRCDPSDGCRWVAGPSGGCEDDVAPSPPAPASDPAPAPASDPAPAPASDPVPAPASDPAPAPPAPATCVGYYYKINNQPEDVCTSIQQFPGATSCPPPGKDTFSLALSEAMCEHFATPRDTVQVSMHTWGNLGGETMPTWGGQMSDGDYPHGCLRHWGSNTYYYNTVNGPSSQWMHLICMQDNTPPPAGGCSAQTPATCGGFPCRVDGGQCVDF